MTVQTRPQPRGEQAIAPEALRERLHAAIARLETALETGAPVEPGPLRAANDRRTRPVGPREIARELRFLRQLRASLDHDDPGPVPVDRAGLGSTLLVRDVRSGRESFCRLMLAPLHALDASQVTLDSPVGRALLGARARDDVWVDGPGERRCIRVVTLYTLPERLGIGAAEPAGAPSR